MLSLLIATTDTSVAPSIWAYVLVAFVGGGGVGGAIALIRFIKQGRIERESIAVLTSQRAVDLVNDALRTAQFEIGKLQATLVDSQRDRDDLRRRLEEAVRLQQDCRQRITRLEQLLADNGISA